MQPKREEIPVTDEDGRNTVVVRITPYKRHDTFSGTTWDEDVPSLFDANGERVNELPDGSYQSVRTGKLFWPA